MGELLLPSHGWRYVNEWSVEKRADCDTNGWLLLPHSVAVAGAWTPSLHALSCLAFCVPQC
jgi:hypothetical protein